MRGGLLYNDLDIMPRIPDSLRALLANLIDYAGLYPPAGLPLPKVLENYESYLRSPDAWMLNRLVLPAARLPEVKLHDGWRITLLVDAEPGPLPAQIETLETKQAHALSLPTYCEAPIETIHGAFAKVRTGGLTPEAIPPSAALADFLCEAVARRIAFKATAGLHHPIRSAGTGMHGFVNVFVAAAFAWQGATREVVLEILDETDPQNFQFLPNELRCRSRSLTTAQVESARRDFAHSFGSCSFEEPVADLINLGWLKADDRRDVT
jgi:hypothetical protein